MERQVQPMPLALPGCDAACAPQWQGWPCAAQQECAALRFGCESQSANAGRTLHAPSISASQNIRSRILRSRLFMFVTA